MQKPSKVMSLFITVLIPIAILLLSSNLVLRLPLTYSFYFFYSQSLNEINYNVKVSYMGKAIAKYFSVPSSNKFQAYEKNGKYEDGVFKDKEQKAMEKAKSFLSRQLFIGLAALLLAVLIYANTTRRGMRDILRHESWIAMGLTGLLLLLQIILISSKSFRRLLYCKFIGIKLSHNATLYTIMGGGNIYTSYLLIATITGLIFLLLFAYINHRYTKPDRIFYNRRF